MKLSLTYFLGVAYRNCLKPIFFKFDPEQVHDRILNIGKFLGDYSFSRFLVGQIFDYENKVLTQNLWGLDFKNPVGLAAGFDKDANIYQITKSVGFGFATVGTVTFSAYEGNALPRLYRLPKSKGLVVYYGLKNLGVRVISGLLKRQTKYNPQVLSVGRTNSKETCLLDSGTDDYINCLKVLIDENVGDIYEINISCPNLYGNELFDQPENLDLLFGRIQDLKIKRPIFVKMPINLVWSDFQKLLDICLKYGVAAVVIGNLNKNREDQNIVDCIPSGIKGSISGRPTFSLSNELISKTYKYCGDRIKIVGVGGIFSAEDAYEKIRRGASLVELITGMIYEGPQLIGQINRDLAAFLQRDGFKNIKEAVGSFDK